MPLLKSKGIFCQSLQNDHCGWGCQYFGLVANDTGNARAKQITKLLQNLVDTVDAHEIRQLIRNCTLIGQNVPK